MLVQPLDPPKIQFMIRGARGRHHGKYIVNLFGDEGKEIGKQTLQLG